MKVMYFGIEEVVITIEYKNIFGKKKTKDITCGYANGSYTPKIVENEEEGEKELEELKNHIIEKDIEWVKNNFKDIEFVRATIEEWHRFEELQGKKLEELFKLMTPEEFKKEFGYLIVEG